jgi:hypothetical protein
VIRVLVRVAVKVVKEAAKVLARVREVDVEKAGRASLVVPAARVEEVKPAARVEDEARGVRLLLAEPRDSPDLKGEVGIVVKAVVAIVRADRGRVEALVQGSLAAVRNRENRAANLDRCEDLHLRRQDLRKASVAWSGFLVLTRNHSHGEFALASRMVRLPNSRRAT